MDEEKLKSACPVGGHVQLDQVLMDKLPPGCKVLSVTPSGHSLWSATSKIVVELEDGSHSEYFRKSASGAQGLELMEGTFEAEQALFSVYPSNVAKPFGWGTYANDPETHFYICEFVEMDNEVPSASKWASAVSGLHLSSMGKSPTQQFGFQVPTHLANVPVNNAWNSSWPAFWAQQMTSLFEREEALNGVNEELTALKTSFLKLAIPKILGPLEEDGRSVTPCLIHSNLWPGNIKPRASTDELCLFDACAYWGHYEADLGICRNPRYLLGPPCIQEYRKHLPLSEPAEDFDKRNSVYALKFHVLLSIMYYKNAKFRQILIDELKAVVAKVESQSENVSES